MKKWIILSVLAAVLAAPVSGQAEVPRGLFRLSFDSTFFRFGAGEREYDRGFERDYDAATFGIGMPSWGVAFAGSVTEYVIIGGRLTMGLEGFDVYHWDADSFVWQVLPFVEVVFLTGIFRPFVMATLGFQGRGDDEVDDNAWWGFTAGGGGGFHLFFFSNLSLDVTLLFDYTVGTGEGPGTDDFDHWRFTFGALVGLSGWFG